MTRKRTGNSGARTSRAARRGVSRRQFLRIGGVSLAGAALLGTAACGGGGGGSAQTAEDGSVLFNFAFGPDPSGSLQEVVQRFNEQNAGDFKANFQEQPADTGQYFDRLRTQFQAGASEIALIGGDVIWPGQFAANGWISDLSDRFTDQMRGDFLPGPVESNTYDGAVYGVPWFTDAGVLYYRQDLLDDAGISGPPSTWDELRQMANQVTGDTDTQFGFVFQGSNYEGGVVNGLEYIYSYGGQILSDDSTEVLINSPEAIAGLQSEFDMVDSGAAPQAVANYAEMESHTTFLNGDAVFLRNWPYVYGLVNDPEQSNITTEQVGVATLPAGDGGESSPGLGGWNFYINASLDEETQNAAWAFIEFASQPEQQKYRAIEGGFLPTLSALYEDQEVLDAIPVVQEAGVETLQNATPRPTSPYYSDMSLVMAEQFNSSLTGDVSPEEAIQTTQQELQDIVDQGS